MRPQRKKQPRSGNNGSLKLKVRPRWNVEQRELTLRGALVKRLRQRAGNQELILLAFEEDGWAAVIDDPLPGADGINRAERLRNAVKRLNRHQKEARIRFELDGTGCRILWRIPD